MKNDNNAAIVTLENGSSYNGEARALSRFEYGAGIGAKFKLTDEVNIEVEYSGKFRKSYSDNTGTITFKYGF